jgi:hypothetical protein
MKSDLVQFKLIYDKEHFCVVISLIKSIAEEFRASSSQFCYVPSENENKQFRCSPRKLLIAALFAICIVVLNAPIKSKDILSVFSHFLLTNQLVLS